MKKFSHLFLSLPILAALICGCTKEQQNEPEKPDDPDTPVVTEGKGITFKLAIPETGNGEIAETFDFENEIGDIAAIVFSQDGTFSGLYEPETSAGKQSIDLPEGSYKMYILANTHLKENLAGRLTEGASTEEDFLGLDINAELSNGALLPMASQAQEFTYNPEEGTDLGTIEVSRMAARIDILNGVEDLTINGITMKNRAVSGTVGQAGGSMEDATYETAIEGNSQTPGIFAGNIYSYQNLSTETAPALTISYTYLGQQQEAQIAFENGISAGSLYSVQLVLGENTVQYTADTWEEGGNIIESFSAQEALNQKLAVANFAATNVKTIDMEAGSISFCSTNNSEDRNTSSDASAFVAYDMAFEQSVYTAEDGSKWRVPTVDEISLLFPRTSYLLQVSYATERLDVGESLPDMFDEPGSGGAGTSDFRIVETGEPDGKGTPYCTAYAIRFKNTAQAAAYRWNMVNFGEGNDNACLSIRIKALGETAPTLDEVCDESYWESEYLEYLIPLAGQASGQNRGRNAYLWTCSPCDGYVGFVYRAELAINMNITMSDMYGPYNLRMVRAE